MANMKYILAGTVPGIALVVLSGFFTYPEKGSGAVEITVLPQFSDKPLELSDRVFRSATGDSLYVDVLRLYLSAIQLKGAANTYSEKDSYHLVDAQEDGSRIIFLKNVPAGRYTALEFNVGTDSLINVSGAQGGDLDPTLGMYWAWNTGYINVKIEGRSKACPTRHNAFEFHIGGYLPPHPTVRRVRLPLKDLVVRKNKTTSIGLKVDVAPLFDQIRLASTNQVMIPGETAARLADYFQAGFGLE